MTKVFEAEAGPNVSVIVPNLEGELMLEECLRSVVTSVGQWTYEVIIVDNGSSDRSVDVIGKVMPKARIVRNRENRGFAEACNQGAEASRGEFFLFLNNFGI